MNRNYYIYCSLCAFILLFSCGNNQKRDLKSKPITEISYPFTIDLSKEYPKEEISLQEVFGDMEYVALETREECLISRVVEEAVIIDENNIFINNSGGMKILRFSRDGKFLNQVCRDGRGPGELLAMTCYITNSNTEEVFVIDILSQQISVFDYSGKFKRRFKTHDRANDINILNDSLLVAASGKIAVFEKEYLDYNTYPYYLISANDGSIVDKPLPQRDRMLLFAGPVFVRHTVSSTQYNDNLILSEFQMDTTYLVKRDRSIEPRYIKIPYLADAAEEKRQYLCATFETDNSAYFLKTSYDLLSNGPSIEGLRVDKFTGEIYNTTLYNADITQDEPSNKLTRVVVKQSPFCMHYEAVQLVELRDAGKLSGKLAEVAAGLTEEDNPVIMIQK